eukprot:CAMPEP_0167750832 /NCGR_PEP_ID=MMETSP0110_2-20121227/6211_1 /TAXON_ID=629695 /ORGANISM="Gymnochlora sp., Strain CCMP2014" /LENGTH=218 /DNA_ID=CAMNT_0007636199 /DNA_START=159 /DNA_END=815 /DNA_ORIENTATION=-
MPQEPYRVAKLPDPKTIGLALAVSGIGGGFGGTLNAFAAASESGKDSPLIGRGNEDKDDEETDDDDDSLTEKKGNNSLAKILTENPIVAFLRAIVLPSTLFKAGDFAVGLPIAALLITGKIHMLPLIDYLRYGKPEGLAYPGIFQKDWDKAALVMQTCVISSFLVGRMLDSILEPRGLSISKKFLASESPEVSSSGAAENTVERTKEVAQNALSELTG